MIQQVPLASVAEINPAPATPIAPDEPVAFMPMADVDADCSDAAPTAKRLASEVRTGFTYFQDGDALVAKITPCFENGKIALVRSESEHCYGSTEFHVVRPLTQRLSGRYLIHFLRQPYIRREGERRMTGSAGQRRVPKNFLEKLKIPLPSLIEQERIAAILDAADALRATRRSAIAKLDELARSIFIEMFGDAPSKGWRLTSVESITTDGNGSIRTGPFGSQLLHSEFTDEGIAVLGIDNAVANEFRWNERRYISEDKYEKLSRYTVFPGDVLITIMGTCGRCAIVPNDIPTAINTKHLCCITVDRTKCLPEYLHAYFLQHPTARGYLERTAKGAIMSGLNMGIIKEMPIYLAPIQLQQSFANLIQAVANHKSKLLRALEISDIMFASLQQHAFAGDL